MYRTIMWDNDGVLVRSEELYYEATREIMRKVHVELMGIVRRWLPDCSSSVQLVPLPDARST